MGERSVCKTCNHPQRDAAEAYGLEVLAGRGSWRKAKELFDLHPQSFKAHMERHVVAPAERKRDEEVDSMFESLVGEARDGLMAQFYLASDDVKPLILIAIHNLEGLQNTKTSQENLVRSLKTVQEMTGMKNEQRMLLSFAQAMFNKPAAVESKSLPVLDVPEAEIMEEVNNG